MEIPRLTASAVPAFAALNDITLNSLSPHHLGGHPIDAGTILQTTAAATPETPLFTLPSASTSRLVLTSSAIDIAAKSDAHLASALAAAGPITASHRGKTLLFLSLRMATAAGLTVGARDAWSEYVKFLPAHIPLPTAWTDTERCLLTGTSLDPAVAGKLRALTAEHEAVAAAVSALAWAAPLLDVLTLERWVYLDAVYRSRVLAFPEPLGLAMVPILDFANHRPGEEANACYALEGDAVVLRARRELAEGEEVTIDYAAGEKTAAEMVFSYGFVEEGRESAGGFALSAEGCLDAEDPLAGAKARIWPGRPKMRVYEEGGEVKWECNFIWLAVTNEEDGLDFRVLKLQDGGRELQMFFKDTQLSDPTALKSHLSSSPLWPVYQLRAVTLLQARIQESLGELEGSDSACEQVHDMELVGAHAWAVSQGLRKLERELMMRAVTTLEAEKEALLQNPAVTEYLQKMQQQEPERPVETEYYGEDLS